MAQLAPKRLFSIMPALKTNHSLCVAAFPGWRPMDKPTPLTLWPMKTASNRREHIYRNKLMSWHPH